MAEVSKLRFYSVGIIAENKKLTSRDVEVCPIEDSPMLDGEITSSVSTYTAGAADSKGAAYQVAMSTTNTVRATWLPIGSSNRMTAPDVRRGETVILYRFADSDQFWWSTLKDDAHLRKLETVIYGFSGTTVEGAKPSADNMYFLEISTHLKAVTFHTSKANGEPYSYDIQINTEKGFIQFQDDVGNVFCLDSTKNEISATNRDGSIVDIKGRSISLSSPDSITMNTKTLTMSAKTLSMNTETTAISASTGMSISSPSADIN
jgi:hypothetical protein